MLWLKAFHIVFVVTWFAGLFYLPRLYVYHEATRDIEGKERFIIMEKRLFAMMTLGAALTVTLGISLLILVPEYLRARWLHVKLLMVTGLVVYHIWCFRLMIHFRADRNVHSQRWLRWFNEIPILFLLVIVILAVIKPF